MNMVLHNLGGGDVLVTASEATATTLGGTEGDLINNWVPLHVHSEYSSLDGAIEIEKYAKWCKENGLKHIAITDHGNMSCAVELGAQAKKYGLIPIYGVELYADTMLPIEKELAIPGLTQNMSEENLDRLEKITEIDDSEIGALVDKNSNTDQVDKLKEDTKDEVDKPKKPQKTEEDKPWIKKRYHLVALAQNKTGCQNLVKIVSHMYGTEDTDLDSVVSPKVDFETLAKYNEGIIISTLFILSLLANKSLASPNNLL